MPRRIETVGVGPVRDGRITAWCFTFFRAMRFTYDLDRRHLTAEDERFHVGRFLAHACWRRMRDRHHWR